VSADAHGHCRHARPASPMTCGSSNPRPVRRPVSNCAASIAGPATSWACVFVTPRESTGLTNVGRIARRCGYCDARCASKSEHPRRRAARPPQGASCFSVHGRARRRELRGNSTKYRAEKSENLTFSLRGMRKNMCHEHHARELTLPSDSGLGSPPPDRCTFSPVSNPRAGHRVSWLSLLSQLKINAL